MPARGVYREASRLVSEGVTRITLLGQNVNSYNGNPKSETRNPKQIQNSNDLNFENSKLGIVSNFELRHSSFPELLEMLCEIEGLEQIDFTTSHPQDATEELFQAIKRNPKISRRFHLPLQSGSNRILKRMKRLHAYEEYKAKIDRLRELVPEISVTTDIITGFSGETEDDHAATVRALSEIRFDGAFIFKYSPRPGTPAARLEDDVPVEMKKKRHKELLALQKKITAENLKKGG